MRITVLGSGTSQGVPVIACNCKVCKSDNPKDKRCRCSIFIEVDGVKLVVDTGPDFRLQMLRENITDLDAVLFTHEHKDHVAGLDDIRAFNFKKGGSPMDIYATEQVQQALKREFSYVFSDYKYPGVPEINLHTISNDSFKVGDIKVTPVDLIHYKMSVKGFRINNFAYITDTNHIPKTEMEKLYGLDVIILDALRKEKHLSHFTVYEAIEVIKELKPKQAYLTHISHLMGLHNEVQKELPDGVDLAHDGLVINL
jgi:phosphoribosyl 1,2-cyclic phosphate phosphodiesterase